jgi:hypothetical protein
METTGKIWVHPQNRTRYARPHPGLLPRGEGESSADAMLSEASSDWTRSDPSQGGVWSQRQTGKSAERG